MDAVGAWLVVCGNAIHHIVLSEKSKFCLSSRGSQQAIDIGGLSDVFEAFATESLKEIMLAQTSYSLRADQNPTWFSLVCQPCCQVGHGTSGRECPACAILSFEASQANQCSPRVESHMHGERVFAIFLIQRFGRTEDRQGGSGRADSMLLGLGALKDRHETIASDLVDLASHFIDAV